MMRKVLVVDDDAAILEVLEMRLTAMGFDVTATGDSVLRGCRSGSCGRIRFPPLLGCSGRRVAVST